jgi:hypothetical protein
MTVLHENPSIEAILPFSFSEEDLWTGGPDRVEHCSIWNAFVIKGAEKIPFNYNAFKELSQYERQCLKDYSQVIFAGLEIGALSDTPTFAQWLGPIEDRAALLTECVRINIEAAQQLEAASKQFKRDQLYGGTSNENTNTK